VLVGPRLLLFLLPPPPPPPRGPFPGSGPRDPGRWAPALLVAAMGAGLLPAAPPPPGLLRVFRQAAAQREVG
jgi:hypothetical protein